MPESADSRGLCHTESVFQQAPADLQTILIEEINGSLLQAVPEDTAAFTPADMSRSGDVIKSKLS